MRTDAKRELHIGQNIDELLRSGSSVDLTGITRDVTDLKTTTGITGKIYDDAGDTFRTATIPGITSYTQILNTPINFRATNSLGTIKNLSININNLGPRIVLFPKSTELGTTSEINYSLIAGQTYELTFNGSMFVLSYHNTGTIVGGINTISSRLYDDSSTDAQSAVRSATIPGITSYDQLLNIPINFRSKYNLGTTRSFTMNINSLGAKTVMIPNTSTMGTVSEVNNSLLDGQTYELTYNGTNFVLSYHNTGTLAGGSMPTG